MTDASPILTTWTASDGYPTLVASWPTSGPPLGRVVVLHGVQSHQGWYQGLGRRLAEAGFVSHLPDRRGSGANIKDRGHTPSAGRLVEDVGELVSHLDSRDPGIPTAVVGISWGGKLALLAAGRYPDTVSALALVCPGVQPRVGVSFGERLRIAWAYFTNRTKRFPIPLSDPALFTANPAGQAFIATDPLGLREATAGLLAASTFIDRSVARVPPRIHQPVLLMLASEDRIVNNDLTRRYFDRLATRDREIIEYPGAHHTLEFEPQPSRYAADLARWLRERLAAR
ncbi:MAG: lysophospholipase [Planctomycetota bacterium]|nr:lysophospholipase [Planctomycetota bacterium]